MGGALSFAASVKVPSVSASSVYYGIPDLKWASPADVKVPLQLHFGALDDAVGFSDLASHDKLAKALTDAGIAFDDYVYQDAGHAFENAAHPECYKEDAAKLAMERTLRFRFRLRRLVFNSFPYLLEIRTL